MRCLTSTKKVPFKYLISNDFLIIRSEAGTEFKYKLEALRDTYNWLKSKNDWVLLGSTNEQSSAKPNTVESWSRDTSNPVNGFYGVTPLMKGRFASYIPAILEHQGFVQLEKRTRNNRVKAI